MKIHLLGIALLALIMVVLISSVQSFSAVTGLYVFGDSLSDAGNVFRATGGLYPPNPPYFQGRYSNGRVWVEYLASDLQVPPEKNHNFAYGGATTASSSINGLPGLLTQVEQFVVANPAVNPDALYVLWAGANDYLYGATDFTLPVNNVSRTIATLTDAGAKTILVANLPDLGNLPATSNSASASSLSELTRSHNRALAQALVDLRQQAGSDVEIFLLDVYSLYNDAITHPTQFGFTNVTGTCLDGSTSCANPDQFLFWDGIHPTTAAHQILGEKAAAALQTRVFIAPAAESSPALP